MGGIALLIIILGGLVLFVWAAQRGAAVRREQLAAEQRQAEQRAALPLVPVDVAGEIVLKPGEHAYSLCRASLHEERVVGYHGGSRGVSVRVVKGVYFRTSGTRGQAERAFVVTAAGVLICTSQRILFIGDRKSAAVKIADVLTVHADGAAVIVATDKKTLHFQTTSLIDAAYFRSRFNRILAGESLALEAAPAARIA
jgi:hypothetical protein